MSTTKLNKILNNRKETPEIPRNRQAIAYPFGILNEQLDAYNLAQIEFFQKREGKKREGNSFFTNAYDIRTIAALNTACEFAHRGVFRNRYAYAIAALAIYCDDIIPCITDTFTALSEFLNAVQKNSRKDDEVAGTVCEWCDRIFEELDLMDPK